jgi:rare lipoprotein A
VFRSSLAIDKSSVFNLSLTDHKARCRNLFPDRVRAGASRWAPDKGDAGLMSFEIASREAGSKRSLRASSNARFARLAGVAVIALTAANCSQQKFGGVDSKYGVAASPRVVRDGEPVPKGGGRNMVGKPYTVAGRTYVPSETNHAADGLASWYGVNFHGRMTANGEVFDRDSIAAAHTTMPLPSYARVTNTQNGRSIIVRVNDRGPFHGNRVIDVSERTAEALDFKRAGTAPVRVEYVGRASTNGSDDRLLLASLRTDGGPASLPGPARTMIAKANPRTSIPSNALALRSYEAEASVEDAGAGAASAPAAPARAWTGPVATHAPLPPERPFDLGTIPNAATPVSAAGSARSVLPPVRPVVAGLHFAPLEAPQVGFDRARTFQKLHSQDLASQKARL